MTGKFRLVGMKPGSWFDKYRGCCMRQLRKTWNKDPQWMILITPEDDGFHWEVEELSNGENAYPVAQGGAAVLSDAVYWARKAIEPFYDPEWL
jgi:hypothetical protein